MKHVDLSTESGDVVSHFLVDRLDPFRTAFTTRTWKKSLVLVMGVLLAPGKRTVSSCLRITGYAECKAFSTFHQVFNRARWQSHELKRHLLQVLVTALVGGGPVIIGVDDTIERRWGPKVFVRGIYRDPVRSSRGHFAKASGLRWLCFMLLTPLPWKRGVKALPFLSLPAPSERYASKRGLRHKKLTDRARQGMLQIVRWFPNRKIIFVGDGGFGTHALANRISRRATLISRFRLDANLFEPPPETKKRGRPRKVGKPFPKIKSYLNTADECWTRTTPSYWYGSKETTVEFISKTGLWYRVGTPPTALRWVLVRDPEGERNVNRHSTVTHDQRPNMTHPQEGGTGGELSEILFFSAKSKLRPSLIYSMQIIPVSVSIVARRKGVSATRRGGLNWTPISLLVGHPCKLFHKREPQAFFCTDLNMDPSEIIAIFAMRWEMEVTFQEARAHLGIETQRQWSEKAITRTTPILLGIYSLVCLWAHQALETNPMSYAATWYKKTHFTFSDEPFAKPSKVVDFIPLNG